MRSLVFVAKIPGRVDENLREGKENVRVKLFKSSNETLLFQSSLRSFECFVGDNHVSRSVDSGYQKRPIFVYVGEYASIGYLRRSFTGHAKFGK